VTGRLSSGRIVAFYLTALGTLAIVASTADIWPTRLIYNASASVPIGWYSVDDAVDLRVGDIVVARPPMRAERLLIERGYLAPNVPLLKRVAAEAGALVCRSNRMIVIGKTVVGTAREADALGRPLPRWSGCRELRPGEVFLLNHDAPGSFDGRYFGPTSARDIIGKARPLWTW
jgi:conjugative transfer signal peptidase TraF